jgi:hypothetical protein
MVAWAAGLNSNPEYHTPWLLPVVAYLLYHVRFGNGAICQSVETRMIWWIGMGRSGAKQIRSWTSTALDRDLLAAGHVLMFWHDRAAGAALPSVAKYALMSPT